MLRDDAYLLDILAAARKVLRYTQELSWEEFKGNSLVQDAVMRNLQIIGECAQRISSEMKDDHPELPWAPMAGLRNRLVHEYSRIELDRIWQTLRVDLPVLLAQIGPLVPPADDSGQA